MHDARCGVHLNQVINEVHKNGTRCKMIMMPPPAPTKNVNEGEQHVGGGMGGLVTTCYMEDHNKREL